MSEHKEPIPSMIYNASVGGHVTNSQQIIDENENKEQSQINAEVKETLGEGGSVDNRISQAKNDIIGGASSNGNTLKKIEDRVSPLESMVGSGGSINVRINNAKSEIIGDATSACDTLGKAETKINANTAAISNEATARANAVSAETTRAQVAEQLLQEQYNALTQSDIIVGTLPSSGTKNKIYRVPGTTSYSDYMWNGSSWVLMATYNNAIDSYLFEGSENLITNGGIAEGIKDLYYNDTLTEHGYFKSCQFYMNALYLQNDGHINYNFRSFSYALNEGDKVFAQGSSNNVWYIFYLPTEPVASDTPRTDYTILATGSGEFKRFFAAPKDGYYLVFYYATGWGDMVSAKGAIDYTDKEIDENVLNKDYAYSPGYLPNTYSPGCSLSGNTLSFGPNLNFKVEYTRVNRGDKVLVFASSSASQIYTCAALFSTSEPIQSITVTRLKVVENCKSLRCFVEAPDDGYIMGYSYATGGCNVAKALIPQEYTNYVIEENNRPYPIYYVDYINNKIKAFYDSNKNNGKQSDAFIFITDIHIPKNYGNSPKLIQGIMQRSVITKVFFGGDIPYVKLPSMDSMYDYWQTFQEFYNRINPLGTLFNVRGNHEWDNIDTSQGNDHWVDLPKSETYATIMGKYSENLLIHSNNAVAYPCYYYFDNIHAKIRYIILDGSSTSAIAEDNYAQMGWLKNVLNNTPEGYEVIIFSHIAVSNTVFGGALLDINTIIHDANNKTGDMSNCVCHVGIVIAGHSHYDFINWDSDILNIVTNCDTFSDGKYYPGNDVVPTDRYHYGNTTKEQSFDVCNIDFEHNIADLIKIGFGPSRRIHLNTISLSIGETTSITPTIGTVTWYSYDTDSAFDASSLANNNVSVNENTGVITGVAAGQAVIMAKTSDNDREFWRIIVS